MTLSKDEQIRKAEMRVENAVGELCGALFMLNTLDSEECIYSGAAALSTLRSVIADFQAGLDNTAGKAEDA